MATPPSQHIPTILLVDDDADARFVFGLALEAAAYEVVMAHDGVEAVRLAKLVEPDAIVMDIMMPRLDGIGAFHVLRSTMATQDIPVVAVTAAGPEIETVLTAGFDEVIFKPVEPIHLVAAIRRHLPIEAPDHRLGQLPSLSLARALIS